MVISIIALLIALLLPMLSQAREQAYFVLCQSNHKQVALATVIYTEDNEGLAPPGKDSRPWPIGTWTYYLLPYVNSDKQIYECPVSFYPDTVSYAPNGHMWLFWAQWGQSGGRGLPTNVQQVQSPSQLMLMQDDAEDMWLWRRGRPPFPPMGANYWASFRYWMDPNPSAMHSAGRHFQSGNSTNNNTWGLTPVSFYDGHVSTVSMQPIVDAAIVGAHWFEFPFVPAASQGNTSFANFVPRGPQPGAEWWTYPQLVGGRRTLRAICGLRPI